jgi:hypothetical protein
VVTGTTQGRGVEAILADLARDIACLPVGSALTIAEFAAPGVTVWKVRLDSSSIPRVRYWRYDWSSLRSWDALSEGEVLDRIRPEDEARIVLARTGPQGSADQTNAADPDERDADRGYGIARDKYPQATAFRAAVSIDDLLGEATALVPLPSSLWYELVVVRRRHSARLELTAEQLFVPGARRGDTCPFTIRCAASDEHGTAFAVVARDAALSFELVYMASARIPPGTYDVTATLLRPGLVRFDGLPATLRPDHRNWLDIRAALPDSLHVIAPPHLIVAVERCGSADVVRARVDRASQLVDQVRLASGSVTCSLLSYASHAHDRSAPDEPVTVLAWQENKAHVLERCLRALYERDPAPALYPRAAQVECMLAEVARRLRQPEADSARRPVLVTIGNKPAFPHRIDPRTGIIPCPARNDWRTISQGLADDHPGMAFGAIRDDDNADEDDRSGDPAGDSWRRLGADGSAGLDAFDPRRFAIGLGMLSATAQLVPLPLAIFEGAD